MPKGAVAATKRSATIAAQRRRAFEQVVQDDGRRMAQLAFCYCNDRTQAEDLVSEAFTPAPGGGGRPDRSMSSFPTCAARWSTSPARNGAVSCCSGATCRAPRWISLSADNCFERWSWSTPCSASRPATSRHGPPVLRGLERRGHSPATRGGGRHGQVQNLTSTLFAACHV